MWAGVALFGATTRRHRVVFWEAALAVGVIVYDVPLLAVAHIANYGFRMFVPVVLWPRPGGAGRRAVLREFGLIVDEEVAPGDPGMWRPWPGQGALADCCDVS